jgi:ubiquitin C-terminal hydrolase
MTQPTWKKPNTGKCGLINMGNTCYMNSIFQILLHHDLLVNYFISEKVEKEINQERKESIVVKEFNRLVKGYWSFDKYHQIKPLSIIKVLWHMNPMFHPYRQNDAQEFLTFLLDTIHTGVEHPVRIKLKQKSNTLTPTISKAVEHWKEFFGEKYSDLVSLYFSQIRTTMECPNNHQSISFNPSSILSVDITGDSLIKCLNHHFSKERVDYKCETCKELCTKQEKIQYMSEYLFIQLKRFQYTSIGARKINDTISYPKTLNLDQFVDISVDKAHRTYELDGLVLHQGIAEGGHYHAYQYHDNKWLKFDDESIVEIASEEQIMDNRDVYLLVYKKK